MGLKAHGFCGWIWTNESWSQSPLSWPLDYAEIYFADGVLTLSHITRRMVSYLNYVGSFHLKRWHKQSGHISISNKHTVSWYHVYSGWRTPSVMKSSQTSFHNVDGLTYMHWAPPPIKKHKFELWFATNVWPPSGPRSRRHNGLVNSHTPSRPLTYNFWKLYIISRQSEVLRCVQTLRNH